MRSQRYLTSKYSDGKKMRSPWLAGVIAFGWAISAMVGSALAQGPEPLPDFNIMTPGGAVTSSANLTGSLRGANSITVDDGVPVRPHQWLLVYVRPNCAA